MRYDVRVIEDPNARWVTISYPLNLEHLPEPDEEDEFALLIGKSILDKARGELAASQPLLSVTPPEAWSRS